MAKSRALDLSVQAGARPVRGVPTFSTTTWLAPSPTSKPEVNHKAIKRGDRVRLSAERKVAHLPDLCEGTVTGVGRDEGSWVYVRWDGHRASAMVPVRFLEGFAETGTGEGAKVNLR